MEWEGLLVYGPGAWAYSDLQALTAAEFYQHLILSMRADADRKHWAITAGSYAERKPRSQREVMELLREQSAIGTEIVRPTELVDDATRVLMIGSELSAHGEKWAARNMKDIHWLAWRGITREEAVKAHRAWLAEEMKNPFWRPGKSSTRRS